MIRTRKGTGRLVAVAALVGLIVAGCSSGSSSKSSSSTSSTSSGGSASTQKFPAVNQPGVTPTEIKVGGVATVSNDPTGGSLGSAFDGVKAYFDYINSTGGVYGRKLVLSSQRDDGLANNRSEVQGLLTSDNVFAALPISVQLFTGAQLLSKAGIPTYGWDINPEWGSETQKPGPANFFTNVGDYICFTCALPSAQTWLPKKLNRHNIGVLAFNVSQSTGCAEGLQNSFKKYPTGKIVFMDKSLTFGTPDYSAQVARMKDKKVDLVISCLDGNGATTLGREMKKQGLDAIQVLPNSYNQGLISKNADVLNGNYLFTTFTPFEVKPEPPGMKNYKEWIGKSGGKTNENSLMGWINADEFVTGLKAAGPNFTRQKVVDATNAITDYTADGLVPPINWKTAHSKQIECYATVKVVDGKFKPVYGQSGKPFLCFPSDLTEMPANPQASA
ncbi:MAG TPA: ABC transporter substrate-binding protein [Acidimicrobiia bacterium]|jgi:ABC-type branched-subunit amino acid transport system substrate-binding protein